MKLIKSYRMTYIEEQIQRRKTYYSFLNKPVSQDKIDILLRNADGATPALCDQYDYRVDIWPDHLKQYLFESSIIDRRREGQVHQKSLRIFKNSGDWRFLEKVERICIAPQLLAPIVFAFSIPQTPGQDYSNYSTNIAMSFQIWHLVQLSQELGLDHSFCRGFDKGYLKSIITASRFKGPNKYDYFPTMFLCIGYGNEFKDEEIPRPKPGKGILNTLRFKLKN